jgi:hypothetical protein
MEFKKSTVFVTNLETREKKEITIEYKLHSYFVNAENKQPGDVFLSSGTIRYIFNKVPACLFYEHNLKNNNKSCLSYN